MQIEQGAAEFHREQGLQRLLQTRLREQVLQRALGQSVETQHALGGFRLPFRAFMQASGHAALALDGLYPPLTDAAQPERDTLLVQAQIDAVVIHVQQGLLARPALGLGGQQTVTQQPRHVIGCDLQFQFDFRGHGGCRRYLGAARVRTWMVLCSCALHADVVVSPDS